MRLVSTIRRPMRSLRPAGGRVARASAIFHCPSEPEAGGERDRARRLPKSGSHMTQRWRKPDSNLYGAFPVKWWFLVFAGSLFGAGKPFFVPAPAIRFAERAEGVKGPKR